MANGVPQQVGRVYVHNTPDGLCYRFLSVPLGPFSSIDLDSGSTKDKGFTQRAEKDMESFADSRKKGIGCQDNVRLKQVSKCQGLP